MDTKQIEANPNFPAKSHKRLVMNFTKEELLKATTLQTTMETAQIMERSAKQLIDVLLNKICLPRVGITAETASAVEYNLATGVFIVYVPRVLKETPQPAPPLEQDPR
jgi:hypothetical protein